MPVEVEGERRGNVCLAHHPAFLEALWMSSSISELFFGGVQVAAIQAGGEKHLRVNQRLRVKPDLGGISDNAESRVAKTRVCGCAESCRRAAPGRLGASEHPVPHTVPGRERAYQLSAHTERRNARVCERKQASLQRLSVTNV